MANTYSLATRRQVFLERLKAGEAKKFVAVLREMDATLRERLTASGLTDYQRARVERLLADVGSRLSAILGDWRKSHTEQLQEIGTVEAEWEAKALGQATRDYEPVIPTTEQIRAAIELTPMSVQGAGGGQLLTTFLEGWTDKQVSDLTGVIRRGYFEGRTTDQILRDLRGTKALQFNDGALALTNRSAQAVIKTTIQDAATKARMETMRENRVVTGVIWVSTLDDRTSQICQSLDGRRFPVDSGPRPPAHINCRSTIVPEIDKAFAALDRGMERASIDGPVPAKTTYFEWLKTQPAAFQDEAIGKTRGALLRDGGISAERFAELQLGKNFEPLTLDEMRKLEPVAFERAGL